MANVEAFHLALSLASLFSAGCMLLGAFLQNTKRFHTLQLCVCITFLTLAAALVVLSSLQLHRMSGGAMATALDILVCLSLTGPPIFEAIALWQIWDPLPRFYNLSWPPVCLFFVLKIALAFSLISRRATRSTVIKVFVLACLGEYLVLLAGGISALFACTEKKPLIVLLFVETLSPLAILALTCVLLVLSWLQLYDGGFILILVVLLASMSICAARFALVQYVMYGAEHLGLSRSLHGSARLTDDKLALTRASPGTRPGTGPSTHHDNMSCKLSERGVEPGDSRVLFEAVASSDVVNWEYFERGMIEQP